MTPTPGGSGRSGSTLAAVENQSAVAASGATTVTPGRRRAG